MKKFLKTKQFWFIMLMPVSVALIVSAKYISGFADFYRTHIYQYISLIFNHITGIFPFSLAEIILITLPFVFIVYILFTVKKTMKSAQKFKSILNSLLNLLCVVSAIFFTFTANCGINYYTSDVAHSMHIHIQPVSTDELYKTCVYLAQQASDIRKYLHEDENGITILSDNANERAKNCVNQFLHANCSVPKNVIFSKVMSYLNITGMYFPFTLEANVNTDVPDFSIPATMCHELAHVNGIMREDDANFIAFLSCIHSNDYEFAYSGYTMAMIYASNALYKADQNKYTDFISYLNDGVIRDLNAQSSYWEKFKSPVAETAANINDAYLKSNSQSDGIKSYGNMVDLTIAYLKDKI